MNDTAQVEIHPINPQTGEFLNWENIKNHFNNDSKLSKTADVNFNVVNQRMLLEAKTDINANISFDLKRSLVELKSKIKGQRKNWSSFKKYVSGLSKGKYLFRGQKRDWPLCTLFHRKGRFRIDEFVNKDRFQLHQRLSAITEHFFDLNVPDQNGAFFNLLQHHGYPTPLLDWSHSPYVAAFFAFRDLPKQRKKEEYVRIFMFDYLLWRSLFQQSQNLNPPFLHLSVAEFIAINNPRLVPQQSVTTATNIHDIESYILEKEIEYGVKFLHAIDITTRDREEAMEDMRFMGITAGSMFPSLDGVCEAVREKNFDR